MIKLIAIVEKNFGLAKNGEIPWEFGEDRALFRELTANSVVIMGKNTFFSHENFPLKNRVNCVITRAGKVDFNGSKRSAAGSNPSRAGGCLMKARDSNPSRTDGDLMENSSGTDQAGDVAAKFDEIQADKTAAGEETCVVCFASLEEAIANYPDAWIIGGAQLYDYALQRELVDAAIITQVQREYDADKFLNPEYLKNFEREPLLKNDNFCVWKLTRCRSPLP